VFKTVEFGESSGQVLIGGLAHAIDLSGRSLPRLYSQQTLTVAKSFGVNAVNDLLQAVNRNQIIALDACG
jgi:hypothetical protein